MVVAVEASSIKEQYQKMQYQYNLRRVILQLQCQFFLGTSLTIRVRNIELLESSNSRKVEGWNCRIFDLVVCHYEMILGCDFMQHIGTDNSFLADTVWWINRSVKMKPPHHYDGMIMSAPIYELYEDKFIIRSLRWIVWSNRNIRTCV